MSHGGIALGAYGEKLAERWYVQEGYVVVARNWRCGTGEIDLLVRRGNQLVVAEVKTRSSDRFGVPAYAVNAAKQRKLRALAQAWLASTDEYFDEVRFDVVSVIGRDVEVIQAAF
jgi:putative endonuclease